MAKATRLCVQLQASQGRRWGKEYHSPNLLSCQANVRKRLPSFLHHTTRMLGDAPEMCWGWEKVRGTLLFTLDNIHKKKTKGEF